MTLHRVAAVCMRIALIGWVHVPILAVAQVEGPSGVGGIGDPVVPSQEDTLQTPRGLGMGTGARAGAAGVSALAYNPANLGIGRFYQIEAISSIIPGDSTYWTLGSAIVDSSTNRLAIGTSFRGVFNGENREYRGWDWRTAAGIALVKQLGIGVGVRWARLNAREDENGQRQGASFRGVTVDGAIRITPVYWLNIAALGYNLINTRSPLAPQTVGGSANVTAFESLNIGGDILFDLRTFDRPMWIAGGGLEYVVSDRVLLRGGYRRDQGRNLNQVTTSAGYAMSKFAIEMSLRQDVRRANETYLLFMVRYVVR